MDRLGRSLRRVSIIQSMTIKWPKPVSFSYRYWTSCNSTPLTLSPLKTWDQGIVALLPTICCCNFFVLLATPNSTKGLLELLNQMRKNYRAIHLNFREVAAHFKRESRKLKRKSSLPNTEVGQCCPKLNAIQELRRSDERGHAVCSF